MILNFILKQCQVQEKGRAPETALSVLRHKIYNQIFTLFSSHQAFILSGDSPLILKEDDSGMQTFSVRLLIRHFPANITHDFNEPVA